MRTYQVVSLKWFYLIFVSVSIQTAITAATKNDYRQKWEIAVRAEMKPNAISFINAVKGRKYKWVEAEIKKGTNPNQMFYGVFSDAQSIIFPIEESIRNGDIRMFDILAPVSDYDCALITMYEPEKGIDRDYMRNVVGSLLWESYHRETSRSLLRHALEQYPRIRRGLDEGGHGMGLNVNQSPREKWTGLTTEACSTNDTKDCAKFKAVLDIINEFAPQGAAQSPANSDMSPSEPQP
ncbi:hypothetical protein [Turneriella parva]|uniref:Uncharacterized protein n=1 Tax=Turneriella parva (strain ATCC BAA-1111 / DSM 21527 / NCTC 11395 / H) TaxID=869212 RepID=I4BA77_TURPD|nr:hypothetical protein [Turneriella parva]AFM14184.1 hypothetical protein Turpa_3549 [Turneriella parva DSM 21527]